MARKKRKRGGIGGRAYNGMTGAIGSVWGGGKRKSKRRRRKGRKRKKKGIFG